MKMYRAQNNVNQLLKEASGCMELFKPADPSYEQAMLTMPPQQDERQLERFPIDWSSADAPSGGWMWSWIVFAQLGFRGTVPLGLRRWAFTIWDHHRWTDPFAFFALQMQWEAQGHQWHMQTVG